VVLLTACVPVISHEYAVEGQGDKSSVSGCSQSAEVLVTMHPTRDVNVVFWNSDDRIRANHRIVSISFVLSNDDVIKFTKPEVLVSSKTNSIPSAVPIATIRRAQRLESPSCDPSADAIYQAPSEPMRPVPKIVNGEAGTDSVFVINIAVSGSPAQITVQLPPMLINDRNLEIPAVTFLRKLAVTY
jgi:hypothetical protein